eukprot:12585708-Ditylum_brightwellii.AAC.1
MKYTAITIASFTFTSVTAFFPGFPGYAPPKAAQSNFLSEQIEVGTMSLSPLGFGTLNLPLDKTQDDANALDVMKTARAKGVNFIDTAEAYGFGKSESLTSWAAEEAGFTIGAAGVEDGCYIATKFAPVPWRPGAESVVQACQASAQRLGVDSIDLYQSEFYLFLIFCAPLIPALWNRVSIHAHHCYNPPIHTIFNVKKSTGQTLYNH